MRACMRVCVRIMRACVGSKKFGALLAKIATYAYMRARIAYPYAPETPVFTGFAVLFHLFAKENFFE